MFSIMGYLMPLEKSIKLFKWQSVNKAGELLRGKLFFVERDEEAIDDAVIFDVFGENFFHVFFRLG